ncbi:MAG: hypothetical protein KAT62_03635 [Desulfuromonadales bacterium]|nr:hypothetical protein [Desulfuromonadales bacterium]
MAVTKVVPPPLQSLDQNSRVWASWFTNMLRNTNIVTDEVNDLINTPTVTVDSETETLTKAGVAVELIGATAVAKVILPKITADIVGKEIKVTLTNHAFDGVIEANSADTINGEADTSLLLAGWSLTFFAQSIGEWWAV